MSSEQDFPCNNCGAKLIFDAETQKMRCPYCRVEETIPQYGLDQPIEESLKNASKGFGTGLKQIRCCECGAGINLPAGKQTFKCTFCGSANVLPLEASGNAIVPKAMVPFKIDNVSANNKFKLWLKKLWFRPNDLKHLAQVQEMEGIYIPFWAFDALATSNWNADAGYVYTDVELDLDQHGKKVFKKVEKVRWESVHGSRQDFFENSLVCGSKGLPSDLVKKLSSFDTEELQPYRPEFLAGWQAESYVINLLPAWKQTQEELEEVVRYRYDKDVPGDEHRNLYVNSKFSRVTFKHILLPIWISNYRYNGKLYQFLVNGQTGEVVGKAPWSIWKIAGTILSAGLGLAAIIWGMER